MNFICVFGFYTGMGYAMLASVPPICGIYMAFFPVLVYVLLGTSKHVSMGKHTRFISQCQMI